MDSPRVSVKWITSRNYDLLWYISACLSGYALIFANVVLAIPAMVLWWFWIVSVDGPHIFATISRTYLDRQEWLKRKKLLLGSLLWFLPGPLLVFAAIFVNSPLPFLLFLVFAQLWAYWHVVRQHYGFMVMYQKKNGERSGKQNQADYWIFYFLMLAPFVSFLFRHPEARYLLQLPAVAGDLESSAIAILHVLIGGTVAAYIGKEIFSWKKGAPLNLPKNILLFAVIPLHLLIFLHPYISTQLNIRLFAVFVTYFHNIQYHGIVWFYHKNRSIAQSSFENSWSSRISRKFGVYYGAALLFTLLYQYGQWFFNGMNVPFAPGPNWLSQTSIGGLFTVSELAIAFWWGFAFNHYYLDQKIWKVSKDQDLMKDLKMSGAIAKGSGETGSGRLSVRIVFRKFHYTFYL